MLMSFTNRVTIQTSSFLIQLFLFFLLAVLSSNVICAQVPSGTGSGKFVPLPSIPLQSDFTCLTVHNINPTEDDRPDVIMVTELGNLLEFYYSGPDGELALAGSYQIQNSGVYTDIVMVDFDFDGFKECLLLTSEGQIVLITTEQGQLAVEEVVIIPGVNFVTGLHIVDIDGDSLEDILVLTQPGIAGGGETWVLSSANNSQLQLSSLSFPAAVAVDSYDLDGDGDFDLVFAGAQVRTYINEGAGRFSLLEEWDLPTSASEVFVCEVLKDNPDGDVYLDIVAFPASAPGCFILAGTSSGLHSGPVLAYEGELEEVEEPLFAQLRGEGTHDLVFFSELENEIHIFSADGEDGNAFHGIRKYDALAGVASMKTADINFDGVLDLITVSPVVQEIQVFLGIIRDADFERGDVNRDGSINIADPVMGLGVLFSGQGVISCLDALDCDDNGEIDIADPIILLSSLFSGGGNLPEPYGECSSESTDDSLDCAPLNALECP